MIQFDSGSRRTEKGSYRSDNSQKNPLQLRRPYVGIIQIRYMGRRSHLPLSLWYKLPAVSLQHLLYTICRRIARGFREKDPFRRRKLFMVCSAHDVPGRGKKCAVNLRGFYGNSRSFEQARFAGSKGNQAEVKATFSQILSGAGVREGGRSPRNPHPAGGDGGRASGTAQTSLLLQSSIMESFLKILKKLFCT